ncbi:DET1- and DDB1-associated protein 1-like [Bufo bufo]|uniref:DET1- and DDB1-associated protein 1-like n=1 Tax=Bufo bufo TaxID=8384 RepID=UPI001ABDE8CB|nr:DET1- and DDB1-associated protein 1-like [Bufo bufo]
MACFLKDLPSHNQRNFTGFQSESACTEKRLQVHLPTSETASRQAIVTDQEHILLRYLRRQERKAGKKRSQSPTELGETSVRPPKIARIDSQEMN